MAQQPAIFDIGHPAPDRERTSGGLLLAGFAGGPVAWSLQLLAGAAISGAVCIGGDGARLGTSEAGWAPFVIVAVNVAAIVIGLASLMISYRGFSRTGRGEPGSAGGVMEAGEGRTRFLSIWAIWTSILFILAILFNAIAFFWTSLCGL
ncbi:hypothetical protein [Aurantimonas sp. VKM B-3413]|uniref:hypothetical protein n=1 Tax=Aurantimonas sp. VKM B-3413 TaxID=2779401 RepID=UPI001E3BFE75|nr:hypothetical protein [Aurantimonas sp. VKM B-3413]MCB8837143.1 hypothetical protein [Aurantimonas sp. VKM B-3413]